jgi:hypothetical protein
VFEPRKLPKIVLRWVKLTMPLKCMVRERDEALALLKERDAEIAMLRGNHQPGCGDVTGWRERI